MVNIAPQIQDIEHALGEFVDKLLVGGARGVGHHLIILLPEILGRLIEIADCLVYCLFFLLVGLAIVGDRFIDNR